MEKLLISFDYGIKYLLKDKGDYEIVEGFISALLVSEGYKPIKIKALLESESNKESKHLKRSIADVIVEDEQGNNYIVEIDRSYTDLFLHKAIFNTSRLIIDHLGANQDYLKIKKVFHINLLYFSFENTKSPLHHGKVIFHEIDNKHPIDIHLVDRGMHVFDVHNIFPEYFIISIPLFDDVIKAEIDEWLYLMKHSEVKEDFKSPYMKKVAERLSILTMTNQERETYDSYIMDSMKGRDYLISAEAKGRAEGRTEEKTEIALNLLRQNLPLDVISSATGLSNDELNELKSKL
jgi:predicted transposase/invertase (TIGR01784 family)